MTLSFVELQRKAAAAEETKVAAVQQALDALRPWCAEQAEAHAFEEPIAKLTAVLVAAKTAGDAVEAEHKKAIAPLNAVVAQCREAWAGVRKLAESVRAQAASALSDLRERDRQWRLAEELRLRREAEKAAAKQTEALASAAGAGGNAVVAATIAQQQQGLILDALKAIPEAQAPVVRVAGGAVSTPDVVDYEIIDIGKLATAYPDVVEVRRAALLRLVRAAATDDAIPGVRRIMRTGVRVTKSA